MLMYGGHTWCSQGRIVSTVFGSKLCFGVGELSPNKILAEGTSIV